MPYTAKSKAKETHEHRRAFRLFYEMGRARSCAAVARKVNRHPATVRRWRIIFKWERKIAQLDQKAQKRKGAALTLGVAGSKDADPAISALIPSRVDYAVKLLESLGLLGPPLPIELTEQIEQNKIDFLAAYWGSAGNASHACRVAGISHYTFLRWTDPQSCEYHEQFSRCLQAVTDARNDYVETQLMRAIHGEDYSPAAQLDAIKYYLDRRHPKYHRDSAKIQMIGGAVNIGGDADNSEDDVDTDSRTLEVLEAIASIPQLRARLGDIIGAGPDNGADGAAHEGDDASVAVIPEPREAQPETDRRSAAG